MRATKTSHVCDRLMVISAKFEVFIAKLIKACCAICSDSLRILKVPSRYWSCSGSVRWSNAIGGTGDSTSVSCLSAINFYSIAVSRSDAFLAVLAFSFVFVQSAHDLLILLLLISKCAMEVTLILVTSLVLLPLVPHLFEQLRPICDIPDVAAVRQ